MSSLLVLRSLFSIPSKSKLSACILPTTSTVYLDFHSRNRDYILNRECILLQQRFYSQNARKSTSLAETNQSGQVSTDVRPLGEKIKENTKTASYMGVIILGIGVTGIMFFAIFRELFSSKSPNSVYSKALDRVIEDPRVQDALGAPIKGFGEESRRRRRTHVAHTSYQRSGINHMRMQFYIQGIRNKATVHLEMRENASGYFEYRYLFVQLDHYPRTTIILEDNRASESLSPGSSNNMLQFEELKP